MEGANGRPAFDLFLDPLMACCYAALSAIQPGPTLFSTVKHAQFSPQLNIAKKQVASSLIRTSEKKPAIDDVA
jgi:hypothetical protein